MGVPVEPRRRGPEHQHRFRQRGDPAVRRDNDGRRHGLHQSLPRTGYGGQQLGYVVAIGPGQDGRQRCSVGLGEHVMLAPGLAPVRRIGAGLFPRHPRPAPMRCPRKPGTSPSGPHRAIGTTAFHGDFCHTPACCQSRSRRQQVIPEPQPIYWGSISQGMPLFNANKMPVSALQSSSGRRPGLRNRRGLGPAAAVV